MESPPMDKNTELLLELTKKPASRSPRGAHHLRCQDVDGRSGSANSIHLRGQRLVEAARRGAANKD